MAEEKPQELKEVKNEFGTKDLIAVLLLIFIYPIGLIFMWFGVKWPKWIKLLLTIPVILAIIGVSLAVFFIYKLTASGELPTQLPEEVAVMCTQEVKLCPDGETYVGREGPTCEFAECPISEPGDNEAANEDDVTELPDTSNEDPGELFPTAPAE